MYRVFLSSTSKDLQDYRDAVHKAIDRLGGFHLVKMEDFTSTGKTPKQVCDEEVRSCDIFIGLLGHYYGSCPPDEAVSFTELEHLAASDAGITPLMFIAPDDLPIAANLREPDESFEHQRAFRTRVLQAHVANEFRTPDDLAAKVTAALAKWERDRRSLSNGLQEVQVTFEPRDKENTTPAKPLGSNPYRGLEAFRLEDADRFFGREELVEKLWQRFLALHGQGHGEEPPVRLLAILGASGSGKSSVAQAGLLAELQKRPLQGRLHPKIAIFTPEARPLERLAMALAKLVSDDPAPVAKAEEFENTLRKRDGADGLRYIAASLPDQPPVILLVDQFEETFSLCGNKDERLVFIQNLLNATRHPNGPLSVLITLRSDFLGAVNDHPEFSQMIAAQHEVVPVMSEDELRRAIVEPAKAAGKELDPAAVDLLIEQSAGEQGALPLLEFALTRIWDGLGEGKAEADTLRELEGVGGAVAKEAKALYENLKGEDQAIAKRAFLAMVRLGEGTRDTRRRALVEDIVAAGEDQGDVERVLALFSNPERRLITLSGTEQGEQAAEVSHEALIDHWSDLKGWLDEERDDLRFHRRLNEAAQLWKDGKGGLWRPPDLDLLNDFRTRHGKDLTQDELAFYEASKEDLAKAARQREAEEGEKQRLVEERQQAELNAANEREMAAQQLAWRTRLAAMIMGLLAIIAGGGGYLAYDRSLEADKQRAVAEAEKERAEEQSRVAKQAETQANEQRQLAEQEKIRAEQQAAATAREAERANIGDSLYRAEQARKMIRENHPVTGLQLALAGLPDDPTKPDRPWVAETAGALIEALGAQRERQVLEGHEDIVDAVALSADGARIVSGSWDQTVRLWDASSGEHLQVLEGHEDIVNAVALSADGARIVSGSSDKTVRLWDASSGEQLQVLEGHEGYVTAVALFADDTRIVSGSFDKTVRLWDASSGEQLQVLGGHEAEVYAVALSADGARIASGFGDGTVRLWDASSGEQLQVFEGHEDAVYAVALSADGARIVSGSIDKTLRLWDASSGEQLRVFEGHESVVSAVALFADDTRIVSGSWDQTLRLWDTSSGEQLQVFGGHEDAVNAVALSANGARIVSGSFDYTVRLWHASNSGQLQVLNGHENDVNAVALSADDARIVSGSWDNTVRIWDASSGDQLQVLQGHEESVSAVALSADGARIVSGSRDNTVRIWDASSGDQLQVLQGHEESVSAVALSADGARIVSGSRDNTVRLWDASSGEQLQVLKGHEGEVNAVALSADGARIVSGSSDKTVRLWDASSGEQLQVLEGHEGYVTAVALFADDTRIVSGSWDNTVRIWDASSGDQLQVLQGHEEFVSAVALSADGARIVSGSDDDTVRIWDALSGDQLQVLKGHEDDVNAVALSADGARIVSGSRDNTVRITWVGRSRQELIERAYARMPRQLTEAEKRRFYLLVD